MTQFKDLKFEEQKVVFEKWKKDLLASPAFGYGMYEFEGQFYGFWSKETQAKLIAEMCHSNG